MEQVGGQDFKQCPHAYKIRQGIKQTNNVVTVLGEHSKNKGENVHKQ